MKKIVFVLLTIISLSVNAQLNTFAFKVGYYMPSNLKSGVMWGMDYGYKVDEMVTVMFGADFYIKTIRDDKDLGDQEKLGVTINTEKKLGEWFGWHLPLMAKVKVDIPISQSRISPFIVGGLGYGITYISVEQNITTPPIKTIKNSLTYSGLVWQAGTGVSIKLGHRSKLITELFYNGADFEKSGNNFTFTTLNSSGVCLRIGMEILF